jgi:hypothetical protein
MRILSSGTVVASVFVAGAALHATGCLNTANDCALNPMLECGPFGSGGSSSTGGGTPIGCDPSKNKDPVADTCGVFVSPSGDNGNPGTKEKPVKTITAALAKGTTIYACAGAMPYSEAVVIDTTATLFGALDCTSWVYAAAKKTALTAAPDAIPLTLAGSADGAEVVDFAITAASPSDPKGGGSSIAVAVDDVAAELVRCDVKASDAADGVKGTTPTDPVTPGQDAPMPDHTRMDACTNPPSLLGGAPGVTMCGTVVATGGTGGKGGITGTMSGDGQTGGSGANPAASPPAGMDGVGGTGEVGASTMCKLGNPGATGDSGGPGSGGSVMGDALTLTGIANSDNTDGGTGKPAQGGGGGGGAKSGMFCPGATDGPGASGGGGGAGGCGGKGGGGGKTGGSSIAIVSLGTKLTLSQVTLASGKGGKGGDGSGGQNGGTGGSGAKGGTAAMLMPSIDGCKGGDGGKGGGGGPGGGGRGGHALGIAYVSAPMTMPMIKTFTPGTPGSGGAAGNGAPMTSNGATGVAGQCWDFTANAACK